MTLNPRKNGNSVAKRVFKENEFCSTNSASDSYPYFLEFSKQIVPGCIVCQSYHMLMSSKICFPKWNRNGGGFSSYEYTDNCDEGFKLDFPS